jgi:hypothetical protein
MIAVPILDKTSPVRYQDITWRGKNLGDVVERLTKGRKRRSFRSPPRPGPRTSIASEGARVDARPRTARKLTRESLSDAGFARHAAAAETRKRPANFTILTIGMQLAEDQFIEAMRTGRDFYSLDQRMEVL